ncbi:MAG: alpha-mannosidase [Candidatus Aminicenantes bacterium]|nr:MAG: alpha-mannosidase [Candidatus Aminicenantes bacterium]
MHRIRKIDLGDLPIVGNRLSQRSELSVFSCVSPKLTVHLICNAHLDPVWQWRWDEGASEALATFRNAVDILNGHPSLIFCHNEAVLYQWAERLDPALFADIRRLVKAGRWVISGGWFIQPDVNLPGTESLIRTIAEGRRYFRDRFDAAPRVAYNFDSFGHSGGLPQILRLAGYEMYVHMRPQAGELTLPADLYRWRGVDGATIPAYRIAVGLYHTEHDNIEERLRAGVELALQLGRDVPVFWGLGNHGGGATRRDLETIDAFIAREPRVRIVHSTPDRFYDAVKAAAAAAPIHDGDLQRSFTGCYTSLSRLKRQAVSSLGRLVQTDAAGAAAWWLAGRQAPSEELGQAWKLHVFNDFHDILTGTCVQSAERDALGQYGRAEDIARFSSLEAASALNRGSRNSPSLPVTVLNANPSLRRIPVEFECMADHRPFWKGTWRMRLFRADGREVVCQEEQPESLLPFNNWRRRISFVDDLPGVGVTRYELKAFEVRGHVPKVRFPVDPPLAQRVDPRSGLVAALAAFARCPSGGPLFDPLVVEDTADSWGTGCGSYRKITGRFKPACPPFVIEQGPVRTITRSILAYRTSRIVLDAIVYPSWPVIELKFRVTWNEERRRLKLAVPTSLASPALLAEVPGGAILRPDDGEEHVHGRWLVVEGRPGRSGLRRSERTAPAGGDVMALGIASSGQHGFDFLDGEIRLSVLRSSAYCHEQGFDLDKGTRTRSTCPHSWRFADIGVHEFRLLVTAGAPASVKAMMPGLADHLAAPPAAYAHLPYDADQVISAERLLDVRPASIRLLACKRSWDGEALIVRIQEAIGKKTKATLKIARPADKRGHVPQVHVPIAFAPFEIKTLRIDKDGTWRAVRMIEEE